MDHRRSTSYTYGSSHEGTAHHTSSAFSASAQPNEDWTKISDLAERRRIQNRIAQRNYRKKLKRRLEDLERKAASTSGSPEPHAELSKVEKSKAKSSANASRRRPSSPTSHSQQTPSSASSVEDWGMFSNQHTRQVSTSPPPFAFPTLDSFQAPPSPQLPASTFSSYSAPSMDGSYQYQHYMQSYDSSNQYQCYEKSMPIKQEGYLDSEISPLSLQGYVPIHTMDLSFASTYADPSMTPELCDVYEYSSAGSPSDFNTFPQTPMMVPLSPPFQSFEQ